MLSICKKREKIWMQTVIGEGGGALNNKSRHLKVAEITSPQIFTNYQPGHEKQKMYASENFVA